MQVALKLNRPQHRFISHPKKFSAFVGGYRSGKTFVGCVRMCINALEHPGIPQGYFAPTYPQITDIFYDTMPEVAEAFGLYADIVASKKRVYLRDSLGRVLSTIVCKSMEHPGRIVGFNIAHALVDEIDCMKINKADAAWKKIIARMSTVMAGRPQNTIDVTTTPEGFNFVYKKFVSELAAREDQQEFYGIVHASTRDNAKNLPEDYIKSLRASYPANLVDAYIDGLFVNMTSGSVYPEFCRTKNHCDTTVQPGEPIHVGIDFNVNNMAGIIYVMRDGALHAADEMVKVRDTPELARMIRERYLLQGHHVTVYPDASGQNTSSKGASISDLSILQQAGFTIRANSVNPRVKDRVNAVNAQILSGSGVRRLKVNTNKCPALTECLEQQPYNDHGEPDKTTGHDHACDAAGYPIAFLFPVCKPVATHGAHVPHMSR